MLKRSFAITMAVGALAVGGGAASALADSGETGNTTTGTTTMTDTPTTVATTVTTPVTPPVTVTTPVKGDDVAEHAANDVMAAANGVQNEAIAEDDDDERGDRHGRRHLTGFACGPGEQIRQDFFARPRRRYFRTGDRVGGQTVSDALRPSRRWHRRAADSGGARRGYYPG